MIITANQTVFLCLTNCWSFFDSLKPLQSTEIVCSTPAFNSWRWTSPTNSFKTWWLEGRILRCVTFSGYKDLRILCPTRRRPHLEHRNGFKLVNLHSFKGWLCLATDIFSEKCVYCIWTINQCSASCISIPGRVLKILSSFTLKLWMNLQATFLSRQLCLLNLV